MINRIETPFFRSLLMLLGMMLFACGSQDGPNEPPNDGRPAGTVRNRFVLASICDLSFGAGSAELYSDFRVKGGNLLKTVPIVDREINIFLEPNSPGRELVVKIGGNEVYSVFFFPSNRDVQLDSIVCQQ